MSAPPGQPDQPVGEYPDITTPWDVYKASVVTGENSLELLREAHRETEELRRRYVALDAKLDAALADRDRWRAAASTGTSAP